MFIGREAELRLLEDFYNDKESRVAVLLGAKGMGKTSLLHRFCEDKRCVYHTAYPTCDEAQMVLLSRAVERVTDAGAFDNTSSQDKIYKQYTKTAQFSQLLDTIGTLGGEDTILLIIDEYHNFVKANASYEETLYEYVTLKWAGANIKLILCGDSLLAMDKYVLGKKSIYKDAKVTAISLGPMGFYDSCKFFPKLDADTKTFLYGITGGIPMYLREASANRLDTIKSIFLDDKAITPEDIMSIDLRELSYYNRMLTTLALGYQRVNEISSIVHKPKDVVVPYMNTLMNIGVVTKDTAITEKNNRKKTRYSIVNTSHLFWYRYIAPNIDLYYTGEIKDKIDKLIEPYMSDYMKTVFINMCKEYLVRKAASDKMPFTVDEVGNWWENDEDKHTTAGFDLVALGSCNDKPCSVFCRCYYDDDPIEMSTLKGLIEMTKRVGTKGDVFYIVFSKSGFLENTLTVAGAIKNIMLISLDDVATL